MEQLMKLRPLMLSGIFIAMFLITPVFADLPTRSGLLKKRYDEDRAKGLIALNRRYIDAYEKELNSALQSKKLEEANAIQLYIKALKAEVLALKERDEKMTAVQTKAHCASTVTIIVAKRHAQSVRMG